MDIWVLWAVMNGATMNVGINVFVWIPVFSPFGHLPGSGMLILCSALFHLLGPTQLFSTVAEPFYIHTSRV